MNPARVPEAPEAEHHGLIGRHGLPKEDCLRRGGDDARQLRGDEVKKHAIAFTPLVSDEAAGKTEGGIEKADFMQPRWMDGDFRYSLLQKYPRRRLVTPPGEPLQEFAGSPREAATQAVPLEGEKSPAGLASPRYPRGYGLVPRGSEAQDDRFRFETRWGNRRHFGQGTSGSSRSSPRDALGHVTLQRNSSSPLDKGLCAEATQFMDDNFLGPRRGKSPSASPSHSRGASPLGSPLTSPRGLSGASLTWGAVSAGSFAVEAVAQRAALTVHRAGLRGEVAASLRHDDAKDAALRRREICHSRHSSSPLMRWR